MARHPRPSRSEGEPEIEFSGPVREVICWHEAGHVVMAHALSIPAQDVAITETGGVAGRTSLLPLLFDELEELPSLAEQLNDAATRTCRAIVEEEVATLLAGRITEEIAEARGSIDRLRSQIVQTVSGVGQRTAEDETAARDALRRFSSSGTESGLWYDLLAVRVRSFIQTDEVFMRRVEALAGRLSAEGKLGGWEIDKILRTVKR